MTKRKPNAKASKFKPGQSGNPKGRPVVALEVREATKATRETIEKRLNDLMFASKEVLESILGDPRSTALDLMVAGIVMRAANDGCTVRLNFLLDRLIGRVKEIRTPFGIPPDGELQNHIDGSPHNTATEQPIADDTGFPQLPPGVELVAEDDVPTFIVSLNQRGKFVNARPRLQQKKAVDE